MNVDTKSCQSNACSMKTLKKSYLSLFKPKLEKNNSRICTLSFDIGKAFHALNEQQHSLHHLATAATSLATVA